MRILCPSCAAEYDVPDALLAPGKRVRCARCGHEWLPTATGAPAAEPERAAEQDATHALPDALPPPLSAPAREPAPRSSPMAAQSPQPRPLHSAPADPKPTRPRPARAIWLAWAASLLIVIVGAYALTSHRASLMRAWPPSTRLFAALGLARAANASPHHGLTGE